MNSQNYRSGSFPNLLARLVLALAFTLGTDAFAAGLQVVRMDGANGKDIVEVAVWSKDHSTLVTAVQAAGLVETMKGPGPYTLFAPTNAAFEKLPKGTVESLLKPENQGKLKSILEHHAAAPSYTLNVLETLTEVDVVDGPKLAIKSKDGKIFVNGNEIKAAIRAMNGMIYVIDSVLLAN
jgi:uncharacterized surface protein with fasciclin (FAS1) repeats